MSNLGNADISVRPMKITFYLACLHLFLGNFSIGQHVTGGHFETEPGDVMMVYYFYDFHATWNSAYITCKNREATLLQIGNSYIMDILLHLDDTVFQHNLKKHDMWMGMVAIDTNEIIWTDTCDSLNVTKNYHRLVKADIEPGCMFSDKHTLEWQTRNCDDKARFICQYQNKNESCGMSEEEVVYVDYMRFSSHGECRTSCISNTLCWAYYELVDLEICVFLKRMQTTIQTATGNYQTKVMHGRKICYRGEEVPPSEYPSDTDDHHDSSHPDYQCDTSTKDNADVALGLNKTGLRGFMASCDYQPTVTVTVSVPDSSCAVTTLERSTRSINTELETCSPCNFVKTVSITASPIITTSISTVYTTLPCDLNNNISAVISTVEDSPSCGSEKTFSSVPAEVLQQSLSQLAKELTVNKKTTSAYLRTKTCAKDMRPSAVTVGSFGALMLALPALFILGLDLSGLAINVKKLKARFKVKQTV